MPAARPSDLRNADLRTSESNSALRIGRILPSGVSTAIRLLKRMAQIESSGCTIARIYELKPEILGGGR